jgi:hypothetical protein
MNGLRFPQLWRIWLQCEKKIQKSAPYIESPIRGLKINCSFLKILRSQKLCNYVHTFPKNGKNVNFNGLKST